MFQYIEVALRIFTYREIIMLLSEILFFLCIIISFILALIIKVKVVPDIQSRYEVFLTIPVPTSTGIISLKIANIVAFHVFHKYIKSKFVKNRNIKTNTYDFKYMYIYHIKYNIYGEKKINIFLCCSCAMCLYISLVLLISILTLIIQFKWQ